MNLWRSYILNKHKSISQWSLKENQVHNCQGRIANSRIGSERDKVTEKIQRHLKKRSVFNAWAGK